jgi:hypothetical protein
LKEKDASKDKHNNQSSKMSFVRRDEFQQAKSGNNYFESQSFLFVPTYISCHKTGHVIESCLYRFTQVLATNPLPIVIPNTYPIIFQILESIVVTPAHATSLPPRTLECFGVYFSFHIGPIITKITMDRTSMVLISNLGFYPLAY